MITFCIITLCIIKTRGLDPLVEPPKHLSAGGLDTDSVSVLAVGSPVIKEAFEFGGVHVVDNHGIVQNHHIIPIGAVDSREVAPLDAFEVITDLRAGEGRLAGLNAGVGLFDVATLVEGSVGVLLASESLGHLVRDLCELAAVHVVLAIHRIRRTLVHGVEGEVEVDVVFGLSHWIGLPSFILTTV